MNYSSSVTASVLCLTAFWCVHVRFGSLTDIEARPADVRFTPKRRHR
jgi:hypothetical protein